MSGDKLAHETVSDITPNGDNENRPKPSVAVGETLRLAREAKGVSIEEVALALKLGPRQVADIETSEWSGLPKSVIRGFVRNYARYLGLDATPLMEGLDHMPLPQRPELHVDIGTPVNMPREGRADRRDYVRIASGVVVLLLAVAAYLLLPPETWRSAVDRVKAMVATGSLSSSGVAEVPASEPAPEPAAVVAPVEPVPVPVPGAPVPLPPETSKPADLPATVAPAAVAPDAAAQRAVSPDSVLYFAFTQPSWVEVRDRSGQVVFSQMNQAGTQREVSGQPPFSLVIGNASRVTLQYRGKPVDLMAIRSKGDVARLTLE